MVTDSGKTLCYYYLLSFSQSFTIADEESVKKTESKRGILECFFFIKLLGLLGRYLVP
jgi:hypothetical protein